MEEGSLFQRMKQIFHEDEMDEEMQKEAAALIRNIFRYMDKDAKDIMTHRKNIVAIDGDWSLEEALKFMLDERFSRFPVYQEDIDEIIGIIHLRDATSGYLDESKRGCPVKELKAFQKVRLAPGEEKAVTLTIDKKALSFFDDAKHEWVAEPGRFEAIIGSSSRDIKGIVPFELK